MYGDAVPDILHSSNKWNVDPWVALALAYGEGGLNYGSVGDGGTSFGPYQLHEGGALPAGKDAAWANSAEGIDYAVRQIASVVGQRTGRSGITVGVQQFERPAASNVVPEIQRDVDWYDKQIQRAGGRTIDPAAKGYHPITSAQEGLQSGLTSVVPGLDSLTGAISSAVSGAEAWGLRIGKVLVGVLLLAGIVILMVKT